MMNEVGQGTGWRFERGIWSGGVDPVQVAERPVARKARKELLVDCPYCGRENFSPGGLGVHYCPAKGKKRLTKDEWHRAIRQAQEESV